MNQPTFADINSAFEQTQKLWQDQWQQWTQQWQKTSQRPDHWFDGLRVGQRTNELDRQWADLALRVARQMGSGQFDPSALTEMQTALSALMQQTLMNLLPNSHWQSWLTDPTSLMNSELFNAFPGMDTFHPNSMAPLGHSREYIRQQQQYSEDLSEIPNRIQAFAQVMADFPQRLQQQLDAATRKRLESGGKLHSVREVIDFWIDAAEAAFAEIAHSPEYRRRSGELTNLLMDLKIQRQRMLDQVIETIGLPSRREMDTTLKRLAALRRENRDLRQRLDRLEQQSMPTTPKGRNKRKKESQS